METRMYQVMTSIPLFVGMSAQDLIQVLDREHLTEENLSPNEVFVHQGEPCRQLYALVSGTMLVSTQSADARLTVEETIQGPLMLEPDSLYGIGRHWRSTYVCQSECQLMAIRKDSVARLIAGYETFRINMLNTLSTLSTRRALQPWALPVDTTPHRLLQLLASLAAYGRSPRRVYRTNMQSLGEYLGITRSLVGRLLHDLQDDQLLTFSRNTIEIQDIEKINQLLYGTT